MLLTYFLLQVLLYLLRRCYGLIYRLLSSSEPVSEELMPIVSSFPTLSAPPIANSPRPGQQAVNSEEVLERGAQVRRPVQPTGSLPSTSCTIVAVARY